MRGRCWIGCGAGEGIGREARKDGVVLRLVVERFEGPREEEEDIQPEPELEEREEEERLLEEEREDEERKEDEECELDDRELEEREEEERDDGGMESPFRWRTVFYFIFYAVLEEM